MRAVLAALKCEMYNVVGVVGEYDNLQRKKRKLRKIYGVMHHQWEHKEAKLRLHRLRSYDDYNDYILHEKAWLDYHRSVIKSYVPPNRDSFVVKGYSYTAGRHVEFHVDFQHSGADNEVNWRERVCCPVTGFNNRMRATIHIFDIEMEAHQDSKIYITEQITPMYEYFFKIYANVTGSEYLGNTVRPGARNACGIRNETLCDLSFPSEYFDIVVSLDVLEHIPEYLLAFKECSRVLKTGGRLLWSVPFVPNSEQNIVLARMKDGIIEYLRPPQYHGDVLSKNGILCFTCFGWDMLEQMRSVGFQDCYAVCFYSLEFGYLGGEQFLFVAKK